jgi:2'-5' RNA ligase
MRPGRRVYTFHVTFAGIADMQQLAASARERLAGLPGLDPVPASWLHLTMQGIGFADEISDADLKAIADAARGRLATINPITISVGPPEVADEGIACWMRPARALDPVRDEIRAAIGDVWGPASVPEGAEWTAHVSVAYANADGPGDPYEAALSGLDDVASFTVDAVDLIKLGRDQHVYEWESIARLPLKDAITS